MLIGGGKLEQTRKIEGIIDVEQIFDIIDEGTTMPVRCRLKNGEDVVVKYMRNPYGQKILVNEWIGNSIADLIGLTIPRFGLCNLTEEVIDHTNQNEDIDTRNAGIAFYSVWHPKSIPVSSRTFSTSIENREVEKIILFDHLVNNIDRHNGNLICDIAKGAILYSIDNSHIILDQGNLSLDIEDALDKKMILSNTILSKNKEIYDILCDSIGYVEKNIRLYAKEIKRVLSDDVLTGIKDSIPKIWVESIGNQKIDNMFRAVKYRVELIDELAEMIIIERREE